MSIERERIDQALLRLQCISAGLHREIERRVKLLKNLNARLDAEARDPSLGKAEIPPATLQVLSNPLHGL